MKYNVNFKYNRKKEIFKDVEIEIPENKITVICGHNGAGKTTLLKVLSGIYITDIKNTKGWLVPSSGGLIQHFSLKEHLEIINAKENDNWKEAYELFNAEEFVTSPIRRLSTGQEMMASLIVALASKEEILFLDEPFASLDPTNAENLVKILKKANRTIVITSHDLYLTTEVADNILFIKKGEIAWKSQGKTVSVDELKEAYKTFA